MSTTVTVHCEKPYIVDRVYNLLWSLQLSGANILKIHNDEADGALTLTIATDESGAEKIRNGLSNIWVNELDSTIRWNA